MSKGVTAMGAEGRERARPGGGPRSDRVAILHLGTHKTGSSAIQGALAGYADDRIEYLDLGGQPNHSRLLSRAFDARAVPRNFASPDREAWPAERQAAREALDAALGATERSVLLSGEHLWSFRDGNSHRKCATFLRRHVGRIEALAYIRPPASFAQSAFQERVRRGFARFDLPTLVPRYREPAQAWIAALDGAEPTFALFHPTALRDGDVVKDLVARLGLDAKRVRDLGGPANASLSAEAAAVLLLWRHAVGPAPVHGPGRHVNSQVTGFLRGFGTRRFAFAPEALAPILAERASDIAWMEERLGAAFPPATPAEGAVIFASEEDILSYARSLGPSLADFAEARGLAVAAAGRSTGALLELIRDRIEADLARSPRRKALGRLARPLFGRKAQSQ